MASSRPCGEFGLSNTEVIERLAKAGFSVKSHSSSVDEAAARVALSKPGVREEKVAKKIAKEKPARKPPRKLR
jgi:hypothetical protein